MPHSATLSLADALAPLAGIAGAEHAQLDEGAISVAPANTWQIADVLRFAREHALTVTPAGGGTKLQWGNPVAPHIRLVMTRMNALRAHSWQDMTCSVEPGCTWNGIERQLAHHGQMIALDPLWPARATIGGIVAANDGGSLRIRYGGLRDLIIGMTVVLADGTIARTGGKVVKNVAGYDLHKLMIGSFGTLGVIADVNFRLHPMEAHVRTWSTEPCDAAQLEVPLRALLDAQIVPSGVQIRTAAGKYVLDVRVAATPRCLDDYDRQLRKIFDPIPLPEAETTVWLARQELFDRGNAIVLKISMQPSGICTMLSEMEQRAAAEGGEISVVAQANGLMIAALRAAPEAAIAFIERLRIRLRASGGSVVVLEIPAELRSRIDAWGYDSSALPLMREIKRRFDPERILNPGRFVGSI
jgi:glycolate dehydrogenase FAD-binding subunit